MNNQQHDSAPLKVHQQTKAVLLVSLFSSLSTLVCCALPALFVSLGAGAVLAGLVSSAPWLVALSQYKVAVFGGAALLLVLAGGMLWRARNLPCPLDPQQAHLCQKLRSFSWWVYGVSVVLFLTGFFFAFLAPYVLL